MNKQNGFTLIELVTVIIILGILAAFAIPRFIDLSGDASAAAIDGLGGSVKAATALAHAAYIVKGDAPSAVTMDGVSVTMSNGYPAPNDTGIFKALNGGSDFAHAASGTNAYVFSLTGDSPAKTVDCKVVYTNDGTNPASVEVKDDCS